MNAFIATAPAAYRPLIGAAIAIAMADAGRDAARRAEGRPPTVPDSLRDPKAAEGDRLLIVVLPFPDLDATDPFADIESAVLAGQYDAAGEQRGMKTAVAAFRSMTGETINGVTPRRIVAATVESYSNQLDNVMTNPVVVCDDGSVWELHAVDGWKERRPVPGTVAGLARQAKIDAIAISDREE